MAVGDVYKLILQSSLGGQDILNVFHYQQVAANPGTSWADELCTEFATNCVLRLQALTSAALQYVQVSATSLPNPDDFYTLPLAVFGQRSGDYIGMHYTWSLRYIKGRTDMHSGGKRFSGVVEGDQVNGLINVLQLTNMSQLETVLESDLTSVSSVFRPVILGKRNGQGTTVFANPISGVDYFGLTSQNSRKFYTSPGL